VQRWIVLIGGLGVAAAAIWFLVTGRGEKPMGAIDDASRERLERVLEASESPTRLKSPTR
jgi:hypothetical protein